MKNVMRYISLAILLGLTSGALAQPYSRSWDESNKEAAIVADASSSYTLDWQETAVPAAPSKPAAPLLVARRLWLKRPWW